MSTIAELHNEYVMAERKLKWAVRLACPGLHRPVQHRDLMPPWCHLCGRTILGTKIQEPTK